MFDGSWQVITRIINHWTDLHRISHCIIRITTHHKMPMAKILQSTHHILTLQIPYQFHHLLGLQTLTILPITRITNILPKSQHIINHLQQPREVSSLAKCWILSKNYLNRSTQIRNIDKLDCQCVMYVTIQFKPFWFLIWWHIGCWFRGPIYFIDCDHAKFQSRCDYWALNHL